MKPFFICLLLFSMSCTLQAQQTTNPLRIYFKTNQYLLTDEHKALINKSLDSDKRTTISKIRLNGNTDAVGSSTYNLDLSNKRALSVFQYLVSAGVDESLIDKDFYGEERPIAQDDPNQGQQENRRVDVYFEYQTVQIPVVTVAPMLNVPKNQWVTIRPSKEFSYTMSKSDYNKYKDSVIIKPYFKGAEIRDAGLNTMSAQGEPLVSEGMFQIFPTGRNGGCLDTPMTIRVPISRLKGCGCLTDEMRLWTMTPDKRWSDPVEVKIIKIPQEVRTWRTSATQLETDDKKGNKTLIQTEQRIVSDSIVLEFSVRCSSFVNIDALARMITERPVAQTTQKTDTAISTPPVPHFFVMNTGLEREERQTRVRIVQYRKQETKPEDSLTRSHNTIQDTLVVEDISLQSERGLKLLEAKVAYNYPRMVHIYKADAKGMMKIPVLTPHSKQSCAYQRDWKPFITAKLLNKAGDTLVMTYRAVTSMEHVGREGHFKVAHQRKYWGLVDANRYFLHKRYRIRRENCVPIHQDVFYYRAYGDIYKQITDELFSK